MCPSWSTAASFFLRMRRETADGRKRPRIGWGEELGALRTWLTAKMSRAGFEPRRGCTTSPGLDRPEKTISWAMQGARMAQIRRDPARGDGILFPRRDSRPTDPGSHSPISGSAPFTLVMFGQGL